MFDMIFLLRARWQRVAQQAAELEARNSARSYGRADPHVDLVHESIPLQGEDASTDLKQESVHDAS
jgi:hypothetical protein